MLETATNKWLQIPKLISCADEFGSCSDEDGEEFVVTFTPLGVSAAGGVSATGLGAGAGIGGISVPKIASGRST